METRVRLFDIEIDNLSLSEALVRCSIFIGKKKFHFIVLPNAQHINLLREDKDFKKAYLSADLVLAAGMSICFLSKLLNKPIKQRINGYLLVSELFYLAIRKGYSVFIIKGADNVQFQSMINKIKQIFCGIKIAGFQVVPWNFNFDNEEKNNKIIRNINEVGPDILVASLGSPQQEKWMWKNRNNLCVPLCLGAGAAIDMICGRLNPGPMLMQRMGMGWSFRLCEEPRRLWKRYLIGNPKFLWLAYEEILRQLRNKDGI